MHNILAQADVASSVGNLVQYLITQGADLGLTLLKAIIIFWIGRIIIRLIDKLIKRLMAKRKVEPSVQTFVASLASIGLNILLAISVVGALGVQTTSFAALLASAGVAVGMALSGNLSNFAGGLIILVFKPYKVGDFIEGQGVSGTVKEIQMFHTVLCTPDNRIIYVPNGAMSSSSVTNYSKMESRRVDWVYNVEYGTDYNRVKELIEKELKSDSRIQSQPAPFVAIGNLGESSVNVTVRVWVKNADYWDVFFEVNKSIYEAFNREGISFPFPQITVHNA